MPGGEFAALGDGALGGAQGDQVQAFQLVAQVAPGVAGLGLGDAEQQQGQPAQLDVGLDALLLVVVDRAQVEGGLDVAEAAKAESSRLLKVLGGRTSGWWPGLAASDPEVRAKPRWMDIHACVASVRLPKLGQSEASWPR